MTRATPIASSQYNRLEVCRGDDRRGLVTASMNGRRGVTLEVFPFFESMS